MFEIARTLAPSGDAKILALAVALIPFCLIATALTPVGRHEIFPGYLTQSHVVTVFVLASWLFALREKWVLAASVLGLGLNISAFVCVWSGVALGLARLWSGREMGQEKLAKDALLMVVSFALLASPTLIWIASAVFDGSSQQASLDFRDFLLDYFPFHNYAFLQPHQLLKVILIATIGCVLLVSSASSLHRRHLDVLIGVFAGLCLVFAIGVALPFATGERLLLLLYPLRSDGFLTFMMFILVLSSVAAPSPSHDGISATPIFPLALLGLVHGNLPLVLASVLCVFKPAEQAVSNRLRLSGITIFLLLGMYTAVFNRVLLHPGMNMSAAASAETYTVHWILVAAIAAVIPFLLRNANNALSASVILFLHVTLGYAAATRVLDPLWPLVLVCGMTALFFVRSQWSATLEYAFAIAAFAIVAIALATNDSELGWGIAVASLFFVASLVLAHWREAFVPSSGLATGLVALTLITFGGTALSGFARTQSLANLTRHQSSWMNVQSWARANTDPDALFLTPPGQNAFATLSRRPIWVDWKTGATAMWWPDYYPTWKRRIEEVEALESLNDWSSYAGANEIDFVVFAIEQLDESELEAVPFIYRNRYYGIAATSGLPRG